MKYAVLTPDQFDDYEVIAKIENSPTFTRSPRFNEELKKISAGVASDSNDANKEPNDNKNSTIISWDND